MTVTVFDPEPPGPVHVIVNTVVTDIGPVVVEPLVALVLLQPDVQEVALVDDQVNVELAPSTMLVGLAESDTVGAGGAVTVTVTVFDPVPPGPVHSSAKLRVLNRGEVASEPLVVRAPPQLPFALQAVALVDDQVNVEVAPAVTLVGFAESDTVGDGGGGTVTTIVAELDAVPPGPVHVSVKSVVANKGPMACELLLVVRAPVQPPLAVHAVALVDDHSSVPLAPAARMAGFADSETVGGGVGAGPVDTTSATTELTVTLVPAAGFWLSTLPAGTVALDCCVTIPTTSPAPVIAAAAAACVRFTTFGTVTVAAVTATVTVRDASPPEPVHVSVKSFVVESAPVASEPLVVRGPLQPPLAVQDVALVDDQVSVELAPAAILVGLADSETVGDGGVSNSLCIPG